MRRLKVGDLVQVTAGKAKGHTGRIQRFTKDDRVVVEGLNVVVRHQRPNQLNTEGGRLDEEAPLHVSNVMPVDGDSGEPTRVKIVTDEDGTKKRVAVSGADLATS